MNTVGFMLVRTLRRGGALVLGLVLGLGFAFVLCLPHARTGQPRCPRCDSREFVNPVKYHVLPDGRYQGVAGYRSLGPWEANQRGPEWQCVQCSVGIGSRVVSVGDDVPAGRGR